MTKPHVCTGEDCPICAADDHSPDNPPPGNIMPHTQMIGRGTRTIPHAVETKAQVVDYAGTKTGRFNATNPPPINEPKSDPSLVEQLARRLELFANDQRAMNQRSRHYDKDCRDRDAQAIAYDSSASALREAMTAQNKALYQVEINTILERFGVSETVKDDISLAIVKEFMG